MPGTSRPGSPWQSKASQTPSAFKSSLAASQVPFAFRSQQCRPGRPTPFSPFLSIQMASMPTPKKPLHPQRLGRQTFPPPQPEIADMETIISGAAASTAAIATPRAFDFTLDITLMTMILSVSAYESSALLLTLLRSRADFHTVVRSPAIVSGCPAAGLADARCSTLLLASEMGLWTLLSLRFVMGQRPSLPALPLRSCPPMGASATGRALLKTTRNRQSARTASGFAH